MDEHKSVPAVPDVKALVQSFASDFLAGGLASVLSKTAMAPIERSAIIDMVTDTYSSSTAVNTSVRARLEVSANNY